MESLLSKSDLAGALLSEETEPQIAAKEPTLDGAPLSSVADGLPDVCQVGERMDEQYASFIKQQRNDMRMRSGDFMKSLGSEVCGLRRFLELSLDEEEDGDDQPNSSSKSAKDSSPNLIFGSPSSSVAIDGFYPSDEHRDLLFSIYFSNVHPVCRILHKPTFSAHLRGSKDLVNEDDTLKFPSMEAVAFAMHFVTVVSMTPDECWTSFQEDRNVLLPKYQQATEVALLKADFLNTVEIVTLQALILYIVSEVMAFKRCWNTRTFT